MVDFKKAMANKKSEKKEKTDLRSALKPTSIKKLKKVVDEDNEMVGAQSNEYLNLEDGKTIKIRIFPGHPGEENFYVSKKCYWLSVTRRDGDLGRMTVLDSVVHGGTKKDICAEYIKYAENKFRKDADKLNCFSGQDSLSPSYSWLCYADKVVADEELKAKLWEFKKTVRDQLNKLAFSEDEDEPIEVDPFTDPDEGLPVLVKYLKNPNKKKGENYYEASFAKKVVARPLSDSEIEHFMSLKPLSQCIPTYTIKDFEKALEGLQNFDEENDLGLFDDEVWLEMVEEIKDQYDSDETGEDDEPKTKKKPSKKTKVKEEEPEEDEEETEEDEEDEPKPVSKKKGKKQPDPEPEDEEEEDEEEEDEEEEDEEEEDDGLDDMDRDDLKKYVKDNNLEVSIKKSMSEDDLREAIRTALSKETEESEDEDDEPKPRAKLSMKDIRKRIGK